MPAAAGQSRPSAPTNRQKRQPEWSKNHTVSELTCRMGKLTAQTCPRQTHDLMAHTAWIIPVRLSGRQGSRLEKLDFPRIKLRVPFQIRPVLGWRLVFGSVVGGRDILAVKRADRLHCIQEGRQVRRWQPEPQAAVPAAFGVCQGPDIQKLRILRRRGSQYFGSSTVESRHLDDNFAVPGRHFRQRRHQRLGAGRVQEPECNPQCAEEMSEGGDPRAEFLHLGLPLDYVNSLLYRCSFRKLTARGKVYERFFVFALTGYI